MIITIVVAVIAFVVGVCVGAAASVDDNSVSSGNVNVGGVQVNGNGDNNIEIEYEELNNGKLGRRNNENSGNTK